mgnify:CR=1 FL=1
MMDATVTNGQLATHLSDLLKDEKVDNNVVETTTNDDLNVLFDEVTRLEQRAKEKASNTTALQLSKNGSNVVTPLVNDNGVTKLEPVGRDVFVRTYSINDSSDANSSDVKSEPVGRDVFAGTHSVGRVQDTSESTVNLFTQTTVQTTESKQNVDDKRLIKVFKVDGDVDSDVYWYSRNNLEKHSRHAISVLSEQEALDVGMHHSKIEGPTKKTYFTQKELDERNKKNVSKTTSSDNTDTLSGTTAQGTLPHTGDVPVPVPLASGSMGLGAFLLAWLKKRKKKRQKRLAD